ncbi:hypothetical protein ACO34A_03820 [Rhizobium sp. ACO-34A]|nr:hypothetical protein ACO34A_03820 [Rhizobium sp. ACO-34A]
MADRAMGIGQDAAAASPLGSADIAAEVIMSDEKSKSDNVHEDHYCEHEGCKKWGAWGYAGRTTEPARWWCGEHYPHHRK